MVVGVTDQQIRVEGFFHEAIMASPSERRAVPKRPTAQAVDSGYGDSSEFGPGLGLA